MMRHDSNAPFSGHGPHRRPDPPAPQLPECWQLRAARTEAPKPMRSGQTFRLAYRMGMTMEEVDYKGL
jgi:hypothetical protein